MHKSRIRSDFAFPFRRDGSRSGDRAPLIERRDELHTLRSRTATHCRDRRSLVERPLTALDSFLRNRHQCVAHSFSSAHLLPADDDLAVFIAIQDIIVRLGHPRQRRLAAHREQPPASSSASSEHSRSDNYALASGISRTCTTIHDDRVTSCYVIGRRRRNATVRR